MAPQILSRPDKSKSYFIKMPIFEPILDNFCFVFPHNRLVNDCHYLLYHLRLPIFKKKICKNPRGQYCLRIRKSSNILLLFLIFFFRKEWSLDDDLIRQELSINNHLVFLPYVIKFITEENVDLETLSDTYSDAFKDYFKMLKSHLPRVTEFIDTFQLKVVENDCEETPNSSQLDASQESESGIESMASTRR